MSDPKPPEQDARASQYALMSMVSSVGASVQDLTALMAKNKSEPGVKDALDAIETTLADVVGVLEKSGIADAIKNAASILAKLQPAQAKAPIVNVTVGPTPITFEAVMPPIPAPVVTVLHGDTKGQSWEVRIPGRNGNIDRLMTIKRVA